MFAFSEVGSQSSASIAIFLNFRQLELERFSTDDSSSWIKEASDVTTIDPQAEETTLIDVSIQEEEVIAERRIPDRLEQFLSSFYNVPDVWSWLR